MSDLKLTPSLLAMQERIEQHNGTLLMLSVTASGDQDGKLNKLRGSGYVVKCDHPSVTDGHGPLGLSRSPTLVERRWRNTVRKSPGKRGSVVHAAKR